MASIVVYSGRLWRALRWAWRGEGDSGVSVCCMVGHGISALIVLLAGVVLMMVTGDMEAEARLRSTFISDGLTGRSKVIRQRSTYSINDNMSFIL